MTMRSSRVSCSFGTTGPVCVLSLSNLNLPAPPRVLFFNARPCTPDLDLPRFFAIITLKWSLIVLISTS